MSNIFSENKTTQELHEVFLDLTNRQLKQGTEIVGSDVWLYDKQKYQFGTALFVEVAELIEHTNWKWWKAEQPLDVGQIQLELVDILHFALSQDLQLLYSPYKRGWQDSQAVADFLTEKYTLAVAAPPDTPTESLKDLIDPSGTLNIPYFFEVCNHYGLTITKLHRLYVAKGVLNIFRQDNGYQEGTYVKVWGGKEDNTYISMIAGMPEVLEASIDGADKIIYDKLKDFYSKVVSTEV